MNFSKYQTDFFDAIVSTSRHITLEAKAGSGKTTTIVEGACRLDTSLKAAFMAFNKSIQEELEMRLPSNIPARTFHAVGLRSLNYAFGKVEVDNQKTRKLYRSIPTADPEIEAAVLRLVSLAKTTDTTRPDIAYAISKFQVVIEAEKIRLAEDLARRVFEMSLKQEKVVDFDDMIFFPAIGLCSMYRLDALFVDERQDMNMAQVAMVKKSINSGGRIFAVGDRNQSIYGFRGADHEAMDTLSQVIGALELPLSICYRCDAAIVRLAQSIVPEIEWRPGAPEGIVDRQEYKRSLASVMDGDFVLCRTNAPLAKYALELIVSGKKAFVRGRDIGQSLITLIRKVQMKYLVTDLRSFLSSLNRYTDEEINKLLSAEKIGPAAALRDQADTIIALCEGINGVDVLIRRIETIFSDSSTGIACSTIHRAKGMEADHVFILREDLLPHPMAKTPADKQQERNLKYVAITRAKHHLTFID